MLYAAFSKLQEEGKVTGEAWWELAALVTALANLKNSAVWLGFNGADELFGVTAEGTKLDLRNMPATKDNLTMARMMVEKIAEEEKEK